MAHSVAASLGVSRALYPYLSELFVGIDALGSSPRRIAAALRRAGIGRDDRVLDLACGKGAAAVEIARVIGCRVSGIDACAPFVDAARMLSERHGVAKLCRFECDLIDSYTGRKRRVFDAAMMIGLWHCERAVPMLRRLVRSGGIYVIDDAVATDSSRGTTLADVRLFVRSLGDEVVEARHLSHETVRRLDVRLYTSLKSNSQKLGRANPRLRAPLREFLARQREANRLLTGPLRPALIVIQKCG